MYNNLGPQNLATNIGRCSLEEGEFREIHNCCQPSIWQKSYRENWRTAQPSLSSRQPQLSKPPSSEDDNGWNTNESKPSSFEDDNGWNTNGSQLSASSPPFLLASPSILPDISSPKRRSGSQSPRKDSPPPSCSHKSGEQNMHRINVKASPFKYGCVCGHSFEYRRHDGNADHDVKSLLLFTPRTPVVRNRLQC